MFGAVNTVRNTSKWQACARCAAIDDENGPAAKCRAESVQQAISEKMPI